MEGFLTNLKLERLLPIFKNEKMEGMDDILELTDEIMKEMGIRAGPRMRLLKAIKAYKVFFCFLENMFHSQSFYVKGKPS